MIFLGRGRSYTFKRPLARRCGVGLDDVFLCNPDSDNDGNFCRVFTCGSCKKPDSVDPTVLNLYDGQSVRSGPPEDFGFNGPVPDELVNLDREDRQSLACLKAANATFRGYSGSGYSVFSGGADLGPADFHGDPALVLGTTSAVDPARLARRRVGFDYLQTCNSLVRECLTAAEREQRGDTEDPFPPDAGGSSGMAVVSEDVYNPDATYAEHAIVPPARDEDN